MTDEKLDKEMINVGDTIDVAAVPIEITPAVQALIDRYKEFTDSDDTGTPVFHRDVLEVTKQAIDLLVAGEPFNSEPPKGSGQAAWKDTALMLSNGRDFYSDIVTKTGELFGIAARTSDDGSIQSGVLALKLPDLVKEMMRQNVHLKEKIAQLEKDKPFKG